MKLKLQTWRLIFWGRITPENLRNIKKNENSKDIIKRRKVTYCDWSTNAKNPVTFSGTKDLKVVIERGRQHECLFARKFDAKAIHISDWKDLVVCNSE